MKERLVTTRARGKLLLPLDFIFECNILGRELAKNVANASSRYASGYVTCCFSQEKRPILAVFRNSAMGAFH